MACEMCQLNTDHLNQKAGLPGDAELGTLFELD